MQYQDLEPLANVVDVRGMWQKLGLPQLPQQFCHIGLLGWHCHNTTKQPWDPESLVPADKTPKMPSNATCIICPGNWTGARGNLMEMLLDLPSYWLGKKQASSLPQGMYNMTQLQEQQGAKATKQDTPVPSPKPAASPKVSASPKPAVKPTSSAAAPKPAASPKPAQGPKPAGSPRPTASPRPQQPAAGTSPKPAAVQSSPKPVVKAPAAAGGAKQPGTPATKPQQGGAKPAAAGLQIVTEELQPM